jgi:hypothetical protein
LSNNWLKFTPQYAKKPLKQKAENISPLKLLTSIFAPAGLLLGKKYPV